MKTLNLEQFTGTEHYYKHWAKEIVYTDGVKYLAEKAHAYWLIDIIASYRRKAPEPFQLWTLEKVQNIDDHTIKHWLLTMKEDSNQPVKVKQVIGYSDFPLDEIKLYLIDGVLLLPSEY
jgi:hypothetical protein